MLGVEDLGHRPARERDAEPDAVGLHRLRDGLAVGNTSREHFLREDVLTRVGRGDHHIAMQIGGRDDAHGIDVGACQQRVEIGLERDGEISPAYWSAWTCQRLSIATRDERAIVCRTHTASGRNSTRLKLAKPRPPVRAQRE